MRAVRLHGVGDLRVEEIAAPGAPGPGMVRLAVAAAGICGSDLHNFRTGMWLSRAPLVPGHELAGTVDAVGAGVTRFAPGDRAVADSRVWCGECPACRRGAPNLCAHLGYVGEVCDGGFAEAVVLPERLLHPVPADLDLRAAAMAEPLAVALHAIARAAPPPGSDVLVAGCGPIGGLAALVLARDGFRPLVADRNAARLARVAAVTGAVPVTLEPAAVAAAARGPVLAAIEATGSAAALPALVEAVDVGARIALVGIFHHRLDLDGNRLVEREIGLLGCSAFADEMSQAVARLPASAADLVALIDAEIGLADVPAAYERLIAGNAAGLKVIVRP